MKAKNRFIYIFSIFITLFCLPTDIMAKKRAYSEKDSTNFWNQFDKIDGKLMPAINCFDNADKINISGQNKLPYGIKTMKGFTLLLVDGQLMQKLFQSLKSKDIIVYGFLHDKNRSMTVVRIEYFVNNKKQIFDLPHSGISGPGVLGGDE